MSIEIKALSSLEKCFLDETLSDKQEISGFTVFSNQPLCYQVGIYCTESVNGSPHTRCNVVLSGELSKYSTVRSVISMPNHLPCYEWADKNYLRRTPGLYPDLLRPLHYQNGLTLFPKQLHTLWVETVLPEGFPAGDHPLTLSLVGKTDGTVLAETTVKVTVLELALPPQRLIHTEWFYTDCIAAHYGVKPFSEKHWRLTEGFLRTAVKNGINMILTPVFTPELDTYVGGERPTTQLMDITVENGEYRFGFDKLDRWVRLCLDVGMKYFEIPHFFSQWGAKHAPKFVARVNGKLKRIFGWETDACGEEYKDFLAQMIPQLVTRLEELGVADKTFFHVSDEPRIKSMEQYLRCKNAIEPYLKGYPIIDALSEYAFYESGVLKKPVPYIGHIDPFLEGKVDGLWAYYCGDSGRGSGRMLAMPLARTRILGVQLWLYNIEGFLHWGYNFYYNENSYDLLDPFLNTEGEYFAPSGDAFVVYPGDDGQPWESLRLNALREAVEDMRLLDLAESVMGRKAAEDIVFDTAGGTLTFTDYPTDQGFLLALRDRLIDAVTNR